MQKNRLLSPVLTILIALSLILSACGTATTPVSEVEEPVVEEPSVEELTKKEAVERSMETGPPYNCVICGKTVKNERSLKKHVGSQKCVDGAAEE